MDYHTKVHKPEPVRKAAEGQPMRAMKEVLEVFWYLAVIAGFCLAIALLGKIIFAGGWRCFGYVW
jgi:formate/nitrite transporter FocA (FNT family)